MNQLEFRKAVRQAKWTGSSPHVGGDRCCVDHAIHKFWKAATIAKKLVELNRKHDLSIMTDDSHYRYPSPHHSGTIGVPLQIAHCSVGRYDSSLFRLPGVGEFDPIPADHEDFPQALDQAMVSLGELVNRTLLELLKPTKQADKEYFRGRGATWSRSTHLGMMNGVCALSRTR